jgi:hypothetical protein
VKELKKPKNIFRQVFKIMTSHTRSRTSDQSIVTLGKIIYLSKPVQLKLYAWFAPYTVQDTYDKGLGYDLNFYSRTTDG